MKDFYVQLMSNASKKEFPDNSANSFKNRLPNPLQFREPGWKVGLASIMYPTPPIRPHQTHTFEPDDVICKFEWSMRIFTGSGLIMRQREYLTITGQDLIDDRHLVYSGKSLMQYIVYRLRREVFMMENDKLNSLVAPDGKRFYPTFVWEGEDLLIDNTKTFLNQSGSRRRPKVLMGRKLVETMNWIGQDRFGNYQLSGNLIRNFPTTKYPTCIIGTRRKRVVTMPGTPFGSTPTKDFNSVPTATGVSCTWTNRVFGRGSEHDHRQSGHRFAERDPSRPQPDVVRTPSHSISTRTR